MIADEVDARTVDSYHRQLHEAQEDGDTDEVSEGNSSLNVVGSLLETDCRIFKPFIRQMQLVGMSLSGCACHCASIALKIVTAFSSRSAPLIRP